jgi:Acyl-CoA dehydrogenase, C-terminal domain
MGAGGNAPARGMAMVYPGTVAGNLTRRAGDLVVAPRAAPSSRSTGSNGDRRTASAAKPFIDLARSVGRADEPAIRQDIARVHTLSEIARFNTERHKAVRAAGGDIPGIASFSKLNMANVVRLSRDLGMELLGARGMLHAYNDADREVLVAEAGGAAAIAITSQALGAQALPIYGGTDQIQRNIIGERTLGLPKEPGDLTTRPFSELPKNA